MALLQFMQALLGWLPPPFFALASGVIAIFTVVVLLRLVALILDVIPFL